MLFQEVDSFVVVDRTGGLWRRLRDGRRVRACQRKKKPRGDNSIMEAQAEGSRRGFEVRDLHLLFALGEEIFVEAWRGKWMSE